MRVEDVVDETNGRVRRRVQFVGGIPATDADDTSGSKTADDDLEQSDNEDENFEAAVDADGWFTHLFIHNLSA